jgi:uncharacterized protein (TIGR02466 family)
MPLLTTFATPIGFHDTDCADLCKEWASEVLKIIENKEEGCTFSTTNKGECTPDNLHTRKEFQNLIEFVTPYVNSFADEIIGINPEDLTLSCVWSNTHYNGSKHQPHVHPNSFLSGVLYINHDPECVEQGNIYFCDPRPAKDMVHADYVRDSIFSDRDIWIEPKLGRLVLFPSWLQHGTHEYVTESKTPRISIAFNYVLNKASTKTMSFRF